MIPQDLGPGLERAYRELAQRDAEFSMIIQQYGVPDVWSRPPAFSTLLLFILEQQVSLASAKATFDRLVDLVGDVTPGNVKTLSDDDFLCAGFSRQKTRYTRALADEILEGRLQIAALGALPDESVRQRLTSVIGIGPWTADVYLLACLGRPDIWPVGDRALQVSAAEVKLLDRIPTTGELDRLGESWRPHRSAAARLLWHAYLSKRGR